MHLKGFDRVKTVAIDSISRSSQHVLRVLSGYPCKVLTNPQMTMLNILNRQTKRQSQTN